MKIVGHRGASADAPENTLESLLLAWEQGAYAAECDISRTRDGRLVLMHDDSTRRTALNGVDLLIEDTPWSDLKDLDVGSWKGRQWQGVKIPLLQGVLGAIPSGRHLYVEIKSGGTNLGADPRVLADLHELILTEQVAPEQVTFISFDHQFLNRLKERLPAYQVYYLTTFLNFPGSWPDVRSRKELETVIRAAEANNIDGIDLESSSLITREWVESMHEHGLKVAIWSYKQDDTLKNARRYEEIGVDFFTTNSPAAILQGLGAAGR